MVITFVCDVLGEENNGTTISTMNVVRKMRQDGHEVRIVCPDEDKDGVPGYFVCRSISFGPFNGYVRRNGVHLAAGDEDTIRRALEGADIVHLNFPGFLASKAIDVARELDIPVTSAFNAQAENYTNHVGLMGAKKANAWLYRFLNKHIFSRVDAIHYPTAFIRDLFRKTTGNTVPCYVISNGVKPEFHPIPVEKPKEWEGKTVILCSARYSKEKDQPTLVRAIARSKHKDDIQLILAGSGPLEKKLRKMTRKWKNPPVFGFHPHDEMVKIYNYADLYVHPSIIDLEAISCLEGLACGITPILSDSPRAAISTFALDRKKNLFHCKNPSDLAKKIDYWIEHPEEAKENGRRYVDFAKEFDFDLCMQKTAEMFSEVVALHSKKRP
ncbi:MAG: glycosyltransferase [Candidatus Enteromonas sp.]|nr:glycosyltransferase [Candidatus Enteromonas sp.]